MPLRFTFACLLVLTGCTVDRSGLGRPTPEMDAGVVHHDDGGGPVDLGSTMADVGTPEPDAGPPPPVDLGPPPDAGCAVNGCSTGLVCAIDGHCGTPPPPPCGGEGAPCCGGTDCGGSLSCGPSGTCEGCNAANADCCGGNTYCDGPFACVYNLDPFHFGFNCQPCGAHYQPCCGSGRCNSPYSCVGALAPSCI